MKKFIKRFISVLLVLTMLIPISLSTGLISSAATSGKCGDNLTWVLDSYGTLTISGTGPMWDYSSYSYTPWYGNRNIKKTW